MAQRKSAIAASVGLDLPEGPRPGTWDYALATGQVSDTADEAHPVATVAAVGDRCPVYVTRAFVEERMRAKFAQTSGRDQNAAQEIARLDAGERIEGVTAYYWLPGPAGL